MALKDLLDAEIKKTLSSEEQDFYDLDALIEEERRKSQSDFGRKAFKIIEVTIEKIDKASIDELQLRLTRLNNLKKYTKEAEVGDIEEQLVLSAIAEAEKALTKQLKNRKAFFTKTKKLISQNTIDVGALLIGITAGDPLVALGVKLVGDMMRARKERKLEAEQDEKDTIREDAESLKPKVKGGLGGLGGKGGKGGIWDDDDDWGSPYGSPYGGGLFGGGGGGGGPLTRAPMNYESYSPESFGLGGGNAGGDSGAKNHGAVMNILQDIFLFTEEISDDVKQLVTIAREKNKFDALETERESRGGSGGLRGGSGGLRARDNERKTTGGQESLGWLSKVLGSAGDIGAIVAGGSLGLAGLSKFGNIAKLGKYLARAPFFLVKKLFPPLLIAEAMYDVYTAASEMKEAHDRTGDWITNDSESEFVRGLWGIKNLLLGKTLNGLDEPPQNLPGPAAVPGPVPTVPAADAPKVRGVGRKGPLRTVPQPAPLPTPTSAPQDLRGPDTPSAALIPPPMMAPVPPAPVPVPVTGNISRMKRTKDIRPSGWPREATNKKRASAKARLEARQQGTTGSISDIPMNYASYAAAVGKRESGGKYGTVNTKGFLGKYQMGSAALDDLGLVKKGTTNRGLDKESNWNIPGGKQAFLGDPELQEKTMVRYTQMMHKRLLNNGALSQNSDSATTAAFLAAAHLKGQGGAKQLMLGKDSTDAYGTAASEYYALGAATQGSAVAPTALARAAVPEPTGTLSAVNAAVKTASNTTTNTTNVINSGNTNVVSSGGGGKSSGPQTSGGQIGTTSVSGSAVRAQG